jgi:hypothetical protein
MIYIKTGIKITGHALAQPRAGEAAWPAMPPEAENVGMSHGRFELNPREYRSPRHNSAASGFVVVKHRWVIERTLSWLLRARRDVRAFERRADHSETHLNRAAVTLMTRWRPEERPPYW